MKSALKDFFSRYNKRRLPTEGMTEAAVLVPLFEKEGRTFLLLTRRGTLVRDHQKEISFPGGVYEEGDRDLRETALRECAEELGIDPTAVEILGEMDDETTVATRYRITPFVAWLPWPCRLNINSGEIEEVLELPLSQFKNPTRVEFAASHRIPFYEIGTNQIWGATGRIIERLHSLLSEIPFSS